MAPFANPFLGGTSRAYKESAFKSMFQGLTGKSATDDLFGRNKLPGEGDQIKQTLEDEDEERKKRQKMAAANGNPGAYGDADMPPATSLLYGRSSF